MVNDRDLALIVQAFAQQRPARLAVGKVAGGGHRGDDRRIGMCVMATTGMPAALARRMPVSMAFSSMESR